ncbi:MAG: DUF1343 domain-containing protein [Polyangiaceae bacterium]|nr:DUF1343 domain-containing protein [Polyangiaceae bacterium]
MRTGLDRLPRLEPLLGELRSRRVGLLAHPASVDGRLVHISRILRELGVAPTIVLGPEHGYGGEAQDMIGVEDAVDEAGTQVVSLYGDSLTDLSPKPEHLAKMDVLVVDLADVGSRYYTFVWTALLALREAARAGVQTIVLDRPNPIGGAASQVEGRSQADGFLSFVGWERVPVRHSMTVGEVLARFAASDGLTLGRDGALRVVAVEDWDRERLADVWDRPFVLTSPNMPTLETALVYPGGCLIEGTNLSEGRGTTRPFEIVGAPFVDGPRLAAALNSSGLEGFVARPLTFQPTFQKHAKKTCGGVQIHVVDPKRFRPYATYLALVAHAAAQAPEHFAFRTERYEFVDDIPAFDLLTGSAIARKAITDGAALGDWLESVASAEPGWDTALREASSLVERAAP